MPKTEDMKREDAEASRLNDVLFQLHAQLDKADLDIAGLMTILQHLVARELALCFPDAAERDAVRAKLFDQVGPTAAIYSQILPRYAPVAGHG